MYVGIDIGGTSSKLGLFENDNLITTWQIKMTATTPSELVSQLLASIKEKTNNITGIGVVIPGFIKNDYIALSPNLHYLNNTNLREYFKREIDCPIKIINDANGHALGEARYKDLDNIMFITLGTGVGGGFVYNHEILEGFSGAFMEIGHIHVDDKYNFCCGCGNIGCLETLASQKGIYNLIRYYRANHNTSLGPEYTIKDVFDLAKNNDELCLKVVDEFTKYLGLALANAASLLNPETIIIGGGISNAGYFLLDKIKNQFNNYANNVIKNTNIILASLGNNAGIYGAYYLIKDGNN